MIRDDIVSLDKRYVWHPYTPMDRYEGEDPLVIAKAYGSTLVDVNGKTYLDGNSQWWVAALGHGHPRLLRVLNEQAQSLVHCSLGGIAHEPAARLAEELCAIAPAGLSHVFYTDNGSTAIEAAVKMAVQAWRQRGAPKKTRFIALDGAFHGDSIGAASLGGVELFRRPFAGVLFECAHAPFPSEREGVGGDGHARAFDAIKRLLEEGADTIAGIVVESIVQGAAGMRFYDADYLRELRALCTRHDVLLILDEVFSGYGRTGPMWACAHAGVSPDLMCIGKTFATLLPMAATLATDAVYDAFRGTPDRAFYYGHTFCGHPLGAALAREVLAIYKDEDVLGQVARKAPRIEKGFARIAEIPGVARVRNLGMIGAADLAGAPGYLGMLGWRVSAEARARGAYLRPLGDTIYICPPLTIADDELERLIAITEESVRAVLSGA